jgi:flagellar biosynthesis protein FlhF
MTVRTYHAEDTQAALLLAQDDFGENAVILSTEPGPGGQGVQVTVSAGTGDDDFGLLGELDLEKEAPTPPAFQAVDAVQQALIYHGAPRSLMNRLMTSAETIDEDLATVALAAALDTVMKFEPLPFKRGYKPILLLGPQGSGMTSYAAKLAQGALKEGNKAAVIHWSDSDNGSKDSFSTSTIDGLLELRAVSSLNYALGSVSSRTLKVVDCKGINPYSKRHMEMMTDLLKSAYVEPVLVMAAGGEPREAAEIASIFKNIGVNRLVFTRLDASKRYGNLLAAADAADMAIGDAANSPLLEDPLLKMNAVALARELIPNAPNAATILNQYRGAR